MFDYLYCTKWSLVDWTRKESVWLTCDRIPKDMLITAHLSFRVFPHKVRPTSVSVTISVWFLSSANYTFLLCRFLSLYNISTHMNTIMHSNTKMSTCTYPFLPFDKIRSNNTPKLAFSSKLPERLLLNTYLIHPC